MSKPTLHTTVTRTQNAFDVRNTPPREWAELTVALLLAGIATFMVVQLSTMEVIGDETPGPKFFPIIVTGLLYVTAIGVVITVFRRVRAAAHAATDIDPIDTDIDPIDADADDVADAPAVDDDPEVRTDWKTLGMVVGCVIVFILILDPVGWLLSAAALYFGVAAALGARPLLSTAGIGLAFSAIIQIAFVLGLGLPLPTGILGGIF